MLTASPFLITGSDQARRDRCREAVRRQIAFYGSTRTYSSVWDHLDREEVGQKLHEFSLRGEWERMPELISDEILNQFAIDASLERVIPELIETYGELVDRLVVSHQFHTPKTLEELARQFPRA